MTAREDFLKINTVDDFNSFKVKYKDEHIEMDKEMVDHINSFFRKICPHAFDPKINFEDYHKRKVP